MTIKTTVSNNELLLSGNVIVKGSELIELNWDSATYQIQFIVSGKENGHVEGNRSDDGAKYKYTIHNDVSQTGGFVELSAGDLDGNKLKFRFFIQTINEGAEAIRQISYNLISIR